MGGAHVDRASGATCPEWFEPQQVTLAPVSTHACSAPTTTDRAPPIPDTVANRRSGEAELSTYIYRIAHNCGVDHLRRRRERVADPEQVQELPGAACPELGAAARQERERLAAALRRLPLSLRQPLLLRLEGQSYEQIGAILELSVTNVGVRLHRATRALRKELST